MSIFKTLGSIPGYVHNEIEKVGGGIVRELKGELPPLMYPRSL